MHEFREFVYLDVQKTGSTFISLMLEKFFADQEVRKRRHIGVAKNYDRSKFYFISVRDPLDQYASLYSYGCLIKGKIFERLNEAGMGAFYNGTWWGFVEWLKFILRPGNAGFLDSHYAGCANGQLCKTIGFQSYRTLLLAIPNARQVLGRSHDRESLRHAYRTRKVHQYVVRYENFRSDLAILLQTRLHNQVSDLGAALAFVEAEGAQNASDRVDRYAKNPELGEGLRGRLRDREWLLFEEFGYGSQLELNGNQTNTQSADYLTV